MARVFLSHASPDKPVVRRISTALRAAGHDPWLDEEEILVGECIPAAVEGALRDSDFVVLCLSKVAAKRGWIEAERYATLMQQFQERNDRILPVRLEEVAPPHLIASIAYVDLFPGEQAFAEGVARLIRSIEAHEARRDAGAGGTASSQTAASTKPIVDEATASRLPARRVAPPTPSYANAEVQALSEQLERARQRKQNLRDAGIATHEVDREILELRRKLREGGQLRAGDALGDGRYLLVAPLGRGGFAVVWEAYDRKEQLRVAIKVLHPHLAGDPQRGERFFRGARVMMHLKHPAVVRVYDPRGEDDAFCYFVMELVPGGNLRDAVLGQRVNAERRLPLILQVGEALAEAHRNGLVHRDIKPANILLDEDGNAKLTDFDLVGVHDTTGGTRTGSLGTVVYAAPECLDRPQEATARADVFGLGMTAIFCLSGHDLSMDTFREPAATVAELPCSVFVRNVLERAVAWKPDHRFADASAMVDALCGALDGSSERAAKSDGRAARTPPVVPAYSMPAAISASVERWRRNDDEALLRIQERPRWAVAMDRDQYGRWAIFEVNGVQQRMRWIPPGTFLMGSPETELGRFDGEGLRHEVTLTRGFWLGETPVTQALWLAVMGASPSHFRGERPEDLERPVETVSWVDCQAFCERLNAQIARLAARLPTEAEWEHACRAGTRGATWVGELSGEEQAPELAAIAWYGANSAATTHRVGRKAPNPYGLHDMLGNVYEWCTDEARRYATAAVTDPVGTGRSGRSVSRGGSWCSRARSVRAARRNVFTRDVRLDALGFRLAGGRESVGTTNESIHVEHAQEIASQLAAKLVAAYPSEDERIGIAMTDGAMQAFCDLNWVEDYGRGDSYALAVQMLIDQYTLHPVLGT